MNYPGTCLNKCMVPMSEVYHAGAQSRTVHESMRGAFMTLLAATAITLGGIYYIHESQKKEREVRHLQLSVHGEAAA